MKSIKLHNAFVPILSIAFLICINKIYAQFPDNLDIIILADVSGSMEFSLDGTYPATSAKPSRWSYIKPGLDALATVFQKLRSPVINPMNPSGGGVSSMRFAFGKFPGNPSVDFSWLENNSPLHNTNLRDYDEGELTSIINNLSIRWAGTPIGTAIHEGVNKLINNPYQGGGTTGSTIFLFTDGKQYGGESIYKINPATGVPYQSGSGSDKIIDGVRNFINVGVENDGNKFNIVSLGFGDPSTASTETDFKMLQEISKYYQPFNPSPTNPSGNFTKTAIYTAFSGMGYGNALSDPNYQIGPGEEQEHPFQVTKYDERLLFLVSWSEPKNDSTIEFTIGDPSGKIITKATQDTNIIYDQGKTFKMFTISKQYIKENPGEWILIVNGEKLAGPEVYSYSVLGYSTLQLKNVLAPDKLAKFTGDKIQLQVSLKANENVIQNALVTAKITGPETGAGNWFAGFPLTSLQLDSVKNIKFPGHVENVYKKFFYMKHLNNISLPGIKTFELPLTFDSQDSLYKCSTESLTNAGIYNVEISAVNNTSEDTLFFRRDISQCYFIEVKPNLDWTFSSLEFKKIKNENLNNFDSYQLKFTPKDKFQNFVKPGKEDHISFEVNNATLSEQPIIDDLQGSYYKDIIVPSNTLNPKVTVQFDNFTFEEQPITDNLKSDNWRFYPDGFIIQGGSVIPVGTTDSIYNGNSYAAVGYYRQLNKNCVINGIIGYTKFKAKINNPNLEYWDISINARWYPVVQNAYRIFINAGGGYYLTNKSSNNDFGFNSGAGVSVPLSPQIEIEAGGNYHNVFSKPNSIFIQIYGGALIRF